MSNLFINPGFDQTITTPLPGWVKNADATFLFNQVNAQSPKNYIRLAAKPANAGFVRQTITVLPNATYLISFYFRKASTSNGIVRVLTNIPGYVTVSFSTNSTSWVMNGVVTPGDFQVKTGPTQTSLQVTFLGGSINSNNDAFLDSTSIILIIVCYSGKSLVHTKEIETGIVSDTLACDVKEGIHQVYDVNAEKFVDVIKNNNTGSTTRYMLIKKDTVEKGMPSEDFYVTSGHKIYLNGEGIKARVFPGAQRIKVANETTYSICVENHTAILINGLHVEAHGRQSWNEFASTKGYPLIN